MLSITNEFFLYLLGHHNFWHRGHATLIFHHVISFWSLHMLNLGGDNRSWKKILKVLAVTPQRIEAWLQFWCDLNHQIDKQKQPFKRVCFCESFVHFQVTKSCFFCSCLFFMQKSHALNSVSREVCNKTTSWKGKLNLDDFKQQKRRKYFNSKMTIFLRISNFIKFRSNKRSLKILVSLPINTAYLQEKGLIIWDLW